MKVIWKGIESTFAALNKQVNVLSEADTRRTIAAMLVMLKAKTPKDTGFASSRWKIAGLYPRFRVENDASYIEYLNWGSSKQAPAYFVESIALRFGKPLGAIVTVQPSNPGS